MKASELNKLLSGLRHGHEFKLIIHNEVEAYKSAMNKKGSSIPIVFQEDEEIIIDNISAKKLLLETLAGNLTNIHLAYVCDCLTLGEKVNFKNELVQDLLFEIADPEINGGYKSNTELNKLIACLD